MGRTYRSTSGLGVSMTVRLDESTHRLLAHASLVTNVSMNAIVNEAVERHLASPTFRQRVRSRRADAESAIRKLAGET